MTTIGADIPLTLRADDAEIAAQALLESLRTSECSKVQRFKGSGERIPQTPVEHYRSLADKVKKAHEEECYAATRVVAYVEEQLTSDKLLDELLELEHALYTVQTVVEREKGTLAERWQTALAKVVAKEYSLN